MIDVIYAIVLRPHPPSLFDLGGYAWHISLFGMDCSPFRSAGNVC